jgi:hypothetical protein
VHDISEDKLFCVCFIKQNFSNTIQQFFKAAAQDYPQAQFLLSGNQ